MRADAALRGEVPDAGVGVGPSLGWVIGIEISYGGVFVIGPQDTAGCLNPRAKAFAMSEIPAHLDRRDAGSGERATYGIGRCADRTSGTFHRGSVDAVDALELRCVGLPEREDFYRIFKISSQEAGSELRRKDLS